MSDYDKEIEEAARTYSFRRPELIEKDAIESFISGAKWQAQKDAERIRELEHKVDILSVLASKALLYDKSMASSENE